MKIFYALLFIFGLLCIVIGIALFFKAGYPENITDLAKIFIANHAWKSDQQLYFLLSVLGLLISIYAVIEIKLKRWRTADDSPQKKTTDT